MVEEIISEKLVTKDLYFAAALLANKLGVLEKVDKADKRHMRFYFSGARLSTLEFDWANRQFPVNGPDYADGIRRMKSIIHAED